MNSAFHLYQLQKVDSQINLLDIRLKEIADLLRNDSEIQTATQALFEVSSSLSAANSVLQCIEQKIRTKRNKLEQSESSLYAGNIKNPKELQDLQKEVASLKSVISEYENEQMEQMILIEQLEKEKRIHDDQLNSANKKLELRQKDLVEESKRIETQRSKLLTEREISLSQVPEQLILTYDDLRRKKSGVAVARVEDQTCSICGTSLTPAECQAAKSSTKIFTCSSCGRVLYAD